MSLLRQFYIFLGLNIHKVKKPSWLLIIILKVRRLYRSIFVAIYGAALKEIIMKGKFRILSGVSGAVLSVLLLSSQTYAQTGSEGAAGGAGGAGGGDGGLDGTGGSDGGNG